MQLFSIALQIQPSNQFQRRTARERFMNISRSIVVLSRKQKKYYFSYTVKSNVDVLFYIEQT